MLLNSEMLHYFEFIGESILIGVIFFLVICTNNMSIEIKKLKKELKDYKDIENGRK